MTKRKIEILEIPGGNTSPPEEKKIKQCVQRKKWCFTFNNYHEDHIEHLERSLKSVGDYGFQREIGKSGTRHLQGWVSGHSRFRPSELDLPCHWTKIKWLCMKGNIQQNKHYCTDWHKRDIGPYAKWVYTNVSIPRELVTLSKDQLLPWQAKIASWFVEYEDALFGRAIHWVWEPTGNIGKSVLAAYLFDQGDDVGIVSGAKKDMKFVVSEMVKGGIMPKLIMIDIPRVNGDHFSVAGIEEIKNGLFMSEKFESKFCRYNRPWILAFSNQPPPVERMSKDRWKVYELVDGQLVRTPLD